MTRFFPRTACPTDIGADDDIATKQTRVAAFFQTVIAEAPALADQLTVLVTTPDRMITLMRAPNDRPIDCAESLILRDNKGAFMGRGRICIYIGPDNTYEKLGSSIEAVLAHELGHWLDGAVERWKMGAELQHLECVADIFGSLLKLRQEPGNKASITHEFRRILANSQASPQKPHYTLPALVQLLKHVDRFDLTDKTLNDLIQVARVITDHTYKQRGVRHPPTVSGP